MTSVTLEVADISCEHCQHVISSALLPVEGVEEVRVDIPTRRVRATFNPGLVGIERVQAILADEDYPVASMV